jgi:hypothetical protein
MSIKDMIKTQNTFDYLNLEISKKQNEVFVYDIKKIDIITENILYYLIVYEKTLHSSIHKFNYQCRNTHLKILLQISKYIKLKFKQHLFLNHTTDISYSQKIIYLINFHNLFIKKILKINNPSSLVNISTKVIVDRLIDKKTRKFCPFSKFNLPKDIKNKIHYNYNINNDCIYKYHIFSPLSLITYIQNVNDFIVSDKLVEIYTKYFLSN